MIFLDTNLLVRLVLRDEPVQHETAKQLLLQPRHFEVSSTVILELVWVLKSKRIPHEEIVKSLTWLLQLPNLSCRDADAVFTALSGFMQGMDFPDALHLAISRDAKADAFATADRDLARYAKKLDLKPPVELIRFPNHD